MSALGMDPSLVNTPVELVACLDGLRRQRALSYEAMERASHQLQPLPNGIRWESLSKSTIGEIITGQRLPTRGKLLTFLRVCEVAPPDQAQWLAAWERARTADLRVPADAVRVHEARPRQLGVHAAIQVKGAMGELPTYIPRDLDIQLRAALAAGADQGCFVLLVGGSSVGKTRTLFEAALDTVPDWWLIHPNPDDRPRIQALTTELTPRTVIWLDELQHYLDADGGLTAGIVRTLLRAGTILVGTLWFSEYAMRVASRQAGGNDQQHARDRELLDLAQVFDVADAFTPPEHARAQELATADGRIRAALNSSDSGLTQVLAAGPELVRWWEQAPAPYAKAIVTAAIDAYRLGIRRPMTADFLADAVPGYLSPEHCATAPDDWMRQALVYATQPLHGAAGALNPLGDGTMGTISGYTPADYLIQYARHTRRSARIPDSLWQASITHVHYPPDIARLTKSADLRMRYRHAETLYRRLPDRPEYQELLAQRQRIKHQRASAKTDRTNAAQQDSRTGERSPRNNLRAPEIAADNDHDNATADDTLARVAPGNRRQPQLQTELLAGQSRVDHLQIQVAKGDPFARTELYHLLIELGRFDELWPWFMKFPAAEAQVITYHLPGAARELGSSDALLEFLRKRAGSGDDALAQWLLEITLAKYGRLDELRKYANDKDSLAATMLTEISLAESGDLEQILTYVVTESRVGGKFGFTGGGLIGRLEDNGRIDEAIAVLRASVDAHDWDSNLWLVNLLVHYERVDELWDEVFAGTSPAGERLIELLTTQGLISADDAELMFMHGLNADGSIDRSANSSGPHDAEPHW